MARHPILFGALGLGAVACILQVVSQATTGWLTGDTVQAGLTVKLSLGLWKTCGELLGQTTCDDIPSAAVFAWTNACRAFGILAIVFMAVGLGVGAIAIQNDNMASKFLIAPLMMLTGSACAVICFAVFVAKKDEWSSGLLSLGYSFALCIVADCLAVFSAVLFFIGKRYINYNRM